MAAACLSAALASCGSGELPGSDGRSPGQEPPADDLSAARIRAAELMEIAAVATSLTTINAARAAADAYLKAAEAAARSARGSNRQAAAQSVLRTAQSERDANQRRLNVLQEALDGGANPGGSARSSGSARSRVQSGLTDLGSRPLTHLELGYTFIRAGESTGINNVHPCSESGGGCNIGGIQHSAERYFNPAFFPAVSEPASLAAAPINGVEAFSVFDDGSNGKLLVLGKYSAARLHILGRFNCGVALGERHNGRPSDPSGGSATWRDQMVGLSMDSGSPLAGESALTYSFGTNTADVQISGIRAIGDTPYTGSTSFAWSSLSVNSDGSFYISGYNNDRSEVTFSSALHPTLGYIDGDFYGPNAEEAAGIFTRSNVNGAFVAGSIGPLTTVDDGTTPTEDETPSDGGPSAQGGGTGSLSLAQRLANLRSRSLSHFERGHNYRTNSGQATIVFHTFRCSESAGTCGIAGIQQGGRKYFGRAFLRMSSATPFTAAPVNGVDAFSLYDYEEGDDGEIYRNWRLLALGQFSAARMHTSFYDLSGLPDSIGGSLPDNIRNYYGEAIGERHNGRPSGASGSATWRGQMVGAAMGNGSLLAGESALTYSFSANTVDVRISNIRAVGDVAPYSGSTSLTWSGLEVNSDGSFYILGYNNDRSGLTDSTALHPTLGYIDGDFYGPNAEEAAGIFTRNNVNGAWVAKK